MEPSWIVSLNQSIGRNVRNYRKDRKISVENIAKMVSLSKSSIVQIERGQQATPVHKLYLIAEALNCSIFDLLPSMEDFKRSKNSNVDSQSLKRIKDDELKRILKTISKGKTSARKKKS
ncbi:MULTISPECIES: helix-turn-helix domain-containing protein [Leptospira]|nr:helix-turn-helix transcriptional regulator [Leptospira venezuelensis]